ncbi:MAG: hypothetical protein C6W56_03000 [Caldibacillus debilis]|nr:MAG: hypothetical protein C6W56_03000 [Caldibacillus debilis]
MHTLDLPIQYIIFLNVFTRSEPGPLRDGSGRFLLIRKNLSPETRDVPAFAWVFFLKRCIILL